MKYWVYINDKVTGPFTADKLVTLTGFTPDTLICSEDAANSGNQEWVKASNIFEFEQPAPVEPAPAVAPAPVAAATPTPAASDATTAALLAKLDALTNQLTSLQSKMEGMQTKLDESLATQQKMAEEAAQRVDALSEQMTQFSSTPQVSSEENMGEIAEENLDGNSENEDFLSSAEETTSKTSTQVPLGATKTMDLTLPPEPTENEPAATTTESGNEDNLLGGGDDEVLSSALDSLHSHPKVQTQEEKESTFQDLLTPVQAEALAREAKANQEKAKTEQKKEEVLAEFTAAKEQSEDVVDQVIKEKEEDENKKSMTMRWLSAGAAVLAGAVGLKKKSEPAKEETPAEKVEEKGEPVKLSEETAEPAAEPTEQPAESAQLDALHPQEAASLSEAPSEEPVLSGQPEQEKPADLEGISATEVEQAQQTAPAEEDQPQEKQTLDFDNPQDSPALSIAPDPVQPTQVEEISATEPEPQMQEVGQPTAEEVAPQPASQTKVGEELQGAVANQTAMPSLGDEARDIEQAKEETNEEPVQELVPNAKMEKPDEIISEADLKDAFSENKAKEDASVEQLFGLASAGAAVAASVASEEQSTAPRSDNLPSLDQAEINAPVPQQENKVNDPTEIELKAGSTYLISDFVPPALASGANATQATDSQFGNLNASKKEDSFELQEIVTHPAVKPNDDGKENKSGTDVSDVTVSQIVLENTIKAKRGAALDIKTVPMVPEPAQSDRLQVEGMDDINTQHDIKSADIEPAGKGARMFVGLLAILLLLGLIYGMMAFMNWIPPQFNLLAKPQQTTAEQQDAQLSEMLGENTMPVQTVDENTPVGVESSQDAILAEVKNYMLPNGMTLQSFIEAKHPAAVSLITWDISTAVDPDNYSILVKVPPENPQSFKISYRFNYNAVTKALDPTISDAKNLLDAAKPVIIEVADKDVKDFMAINDSLEQLSYLAPCLQSQADVLKGYTSCVCEQNDQKAIAIFRNWKSILAKHPQWTPDATLNWFEKKDGKIVRTKAIGLKAVNSILQATESCVK